MAIYSSCKALIIGISRYADPQYDLSYARPDAEALAELLGNEFGFDQIWTLYDVDATRQNLIRFFEQDLQRTDEDDGILIFFAGHGITVTSAIGDDRGFLVPHDGDPKQPYTNLSLTAIRDDYLPMIPAKHVLLIVDACYGGLALRDVAAVERPRTIDDALLAELTRSDRKVRQVLAAGTKDQRVLDGGLFGHSVFSGRLIEALREANPYVTADHVGAHVRERVAHDALDRKHRQTPQFGYLAGSEGTFVFSRLSTTITYPRVDTAIPPPARTICIDGPMPTVVGNARDDSITLWRPTYSAWWARLFSRFDRDLDRCVRMIARYAGRRSFIIDIAAGKYEPGSNATAKQRSRYQHNWESKLRMCATLIKKALIARGFRAVASNPDFAVRLVTFRPEGGLCLEHDAPSDSAVSVAFVDSATGDIMYETNLYITRRDLR